MSVTDTGSCISALLVNARTLYSTYCGGEMHESYQNCQDSIGAIDDEIVLT